MTGAVLGAAVLLGPGATAASAAAPPLPDFTVSTPDTHVTAGRGDGGLVGLELDNESSTPDATGVLTVTFPDGLSPAAHPLEQQGSGDPVCMTAGAVLTCPLQHLDTFDGQQLGLRFRAAGTLAIGSRPDLGVTFTPTGGDAHPDDNTLAVPVTILGTADLHYALSIPTTTLTLGTPVTGTATITNRGPDPASRVGIYVGVLAQPQEVSVRLPNGPAPSGPHSAAIGKVSLGGIPVGATVRVPVVITVGVLDANGYTFLLNADPGDTATVDPREQCSTRACDAAASIRLSAVRRPAGAPTSGSGRSGAGTNPTASASDAPLADTGTAAGALGLSGLALLLAGVWLCALGRRGLGRRGLGRRGLGRRAQAAHRA